MRRVLALFWVFWYVLLAAPGRGESGAALPKEIPGDHWSCAEIRGLWEKYEVVGGPSVPKWDGQRIDRTELARRLLRVLEKAQTKYEAEGKAFPEEDRVRLIELHEALKEDLGQLDAYVTRREAIQKMLFKPEEAALLYRIGVGSFLREDAVKNFSLSDVSYDPGRREDRFVYRVKPFAFWHPAEYLDLHVEGQAYGHQGVGKDFDMAALYQGYLETKIPCQDWLVLKGGRQEFVYGSAFVLGADSFYDGLTFDGARLRVNPVEPLSVDLLWGQYATPFSGGVRGELSGLYATYTLSEGNAVEAYFFSDTGSADRHAGERTFTSGARLTAKMGPFAVEFEPVYETGRLFDADKDQNEDIDAYGGHIDLAAEATLFERQNTFFLSYALGSGSKEAANGGFPGKEFKNPNTDTALTGDMGVVGDLSGTNAGDSHASGLHILTAGWGADLLERINLSATGRYFLANRAPDGFSRHIGLETDFTLTYTLSEELSLVAGYDRFFTGKFFRDATGSAEDISYGYLMLQFNVARTGFKVPKQ